MTIYNIICLDEGVAGNPPYIKFIESFTSKEKATIQLDKFVAAYTETDEDSSNINKNFKIHKWKKDSVTLTHLYFDSYITLDIQESQILLSELLLKP